MGHSYSHVYYIQRQCITDNMEDIYINQYPSEMTPPKSNKKEAITILKYMRDTNPDEKYRLVRYNYDKNGYIDRSVMKIINKYYNSLFFKICSNI